MGAESQEPQAPSTLVARVLTPGAWRHQAIESSRSLDLQRGSAEAKSDFQEFKEKVHEHHVWLSESIKANKFGLLVLYDAAIAGGELHSESNILLHIFRFYCGRQGIMGNGATRTFDTIQHSHSVMVMAEFIKFVREMVPCAQITTQEITWIIHRTKMLAVPVLWQRSWGPPPADSDTAGYKITFPEFLCALIRVAVLCFPGDPGAALVEFHMDAIKNIAVELELERGMLNFKEKTIAIGRSSGGFSAWVDSSFRGPRPSDQQPAWGRRREESAGAALEELDGDADLLGSLCDALLRLGGSGADTPWTASEGCFLAMVVHQTGAQLQGLNPTLSDGEAPHKFQIVVQNQRKRNQKFFLRLQNLPMFTQVKKPRAQSFDAHAPDQNAAAPGHSIAFLLYAFTDKIGLIQGEIVVSNSEGGPALYSVPVFLKVVAAPLKREEPRPQPTPRATLSRHIRDKGLTPVRARTSPWDSKTLHTPQQTPRDILGGTAFTATPRSLRDALPSPPKMGSPPSFHKFRGKVPTLDLSQASLSRTGVDQLRMTTAQTDRPGPSQFGNTGSHLLSSQGDGTARRPKTTRVDISGGVKLGRQGASNHPHTPFYLTHGRCSSGFYSMALTARPRLHIDLLSGGILRTVNLHERC